MQLQTLHWCYWALRVRVFITPGVLRLIPQSSCPRREGTVAPGGGGQGKTVLTQIGVEKGCASPLSQG